MPKVLKNILIIFFVILLLTLLRFFISSEYFEQFSNFVSKNFLIFLFILFSYRFVSGLLPFLPADIFTFIAIPTIGLYQMIFIDFFVGLVTAICAYYIGNKNGIKILTNFFGRDKIEKFKQLEVLPNHQIITLSVLRVLYFGLFSSLVCYWAGIEKFKIKNFIVSDIVFFLILRLPVFIIGSQIISSNTNILILLVILIIFLLMNYWILRYVKFER